MSRIRASVKKTVLCAVKFWSRAYGSAPPLSIDGSGAGVLTVRKSTRMVARRQGYSAAEIAKAEAQLIREGLLEVKTDDVENALYGMDIRVTAKGRKVSCARVKLAPWTDARYPGSSLSGQRRRR